jgi:DNA polymerase-3 subunit chi
VTDTCQIDFYVLQNEALTAERLACRLAMMAWEQGYTIALLTDNEQDASDMDDLMWNYPHERFLPHAIAGGEQSAPVLIGTATSLPEEQGEVIINLSNTAVANPGKFKRLLEIVPVNQADRTVSRDKFRYYRDHGLSPESHKIG